MATEEKEKPNTQVFREAQTQAEDAIDELYSIAAAMNAVCMYDLARKITLQVSEVFAGVEAMGKAYSAELDGRLKDAQQASANMLNAALAGVELGKKNDHAA